MNKFIVTTIVVFSLSLPQPTNTVETWDSIFSSISKVCLVAATALVGVAGLTKLAAWWFESDEQVLKKTCDQYETLHYHTNLVLSIINPRSDSIPHGEQGRIIRVVDEQVLYDIATVVTKNGFDMKSYSAALASEMSQLERRCSYLYKRINALMQSSNRDERHTVNQMQAITKKIDELLMHTSFVSKYCNYHQGYFNLWYAENEVRDLFTAEVTIMQSTPVDCDYLQEMVIKSICDCKNSWGIRYPHLEYIKRIDKALVLLERTIWAAPAHYKDRMQWTKWLVDALKYIKAMVVVKPEYTQEIRDQERESFKKNSN